MTTKHITAAECREHVLSSPPKMQRAIHRAADALDAKDAAIHGLQERVNTLRADLASAKARCERMADAIRSLGRCATCDRRHNAIRGIDVPFKPYHDCGACDGSGLSDEARAALADETSADRREETGR